MDPNKAAVEAEAPVVPTQVGPAMTKRSLFGRLGMLLNMVGPSRFLYKVCWGDMDHMKTIYLALLISQCVLAVVLHRMRTVTGIFIVPVYMTSLLFLPFLDYGLGDTTPSAILSRAVLVLLIATFLGALKVAICMSVCLHRYAAHAAFKCGPIMTCVLYVLGCLAFQDGPIWWASIHRRHHKYCDQSGDPHSAIQHGTEKAFAFYRFHFHIEDQFVPRSMDTAYFIFVDCYISWTIVTLEYYLWYLAGGMVGLFIGYMSSWMCQCVTLWFNIVNHPPQVETECKAADYQGKLTLWYPGFILFDALTPLYAALSSEDHHKHHHDHFALAKRGPYDVAYFCFILPLEKLGLVWNVKCESTA